MNIERLKSLLGDDEDKVERFLNIFQTQIPRDLSQLSDAISNENWSQVSIIAHGIKSQVRYLDLEEMATIAQEIEQNAERVENLDTMNDDFADLESGLYQVIDTL